MRPRPKAEMVDRVAKEVMAEFNKLGLEITIQDARNIARAAIEAMREPTAGMKKLMAASDVSWLPEFWESMIDEAFAASPDLKG